MRLRAWHVNSKCLLVIDGVDDGTYGDELNDFIYPLKEFFDGIIIAKTEIEIGESV